MMTWATRLAVLLFFIVTTLLASAALFNVDIYPDNYFIAAIMETLIVITLPLFGNNSVTRDCQKVGMALVVAHAYGFVIYELGYDPDSYDAAQILLIAGQYARLFWAGHDDHNLNNDFRLDRLFDAHSGLR